MCGEAEEGVHLKRTVYILGAGFSAYAGVPMMDGFLPEARRMYFRSEVIGATRAFYETVFKHVGSLDRCGQYVDFNFHNLEDVFGLIEMANTLKDNGPSPALPSVIAFRELVKHLIEQKQHAYLDNEMKRGLYATFIEQFIVARSDSTAIVTFNYDEVFEHTVDFHNRMAPTSPWPTIHTRFGKGGKGGLDVLKLHGSISWTRKDGAPHIIPPTWNKTLTPEDREVFDPIWDRASTHISGAERLIFIGYSFPSTDQYFRQFLAYSLAKNERLQEIVVVDPSADVGRTFEAVLDSHFRRYFHPYPVTFEHMVEYENKADREVALACHLSLKS